jgi:hypothetical protein
MLELLERLQADAAFLERTRPLRNVAPKEQPAALDAFVSSMMRFAGVRRREARIARLERADRLEATGWRSNRDQVPEAIAGFGDAVRSLEQRVEALRPMFRSELDEVIGLAADETHALRQFIRSAALTIGFSGDEAEWLFSELKGIQFRPLQLLPGDPADDLLTLLNSLSAGENGLLFAGFPRLTGDTDNDARLEKIIVRLRDKGVTASVFLAIAIVLTAHAAATLKGS